MSTRLVSRIDHNPWIWAAAVLLLGLVGFGAMQLWHIVNPPRAETASVDPTCDLHNETCTATFSDGSQLTLRVSPNPIVQQHPLTLEVELQGLNIASLVADIVGIGMNMGYNRPALSAAGESRFVGQAILPVCILNEMPWELRLMAHTTDRGLLVAPFRFTTTKTTL